MRYLMDNELISKLDNIVSDLNNTYEAKRTIELKNKLLNDKELESNFYFFSKEVSSILSSLTK